ncbi:MAG TPA: RNA polymerase sigma factor RpoD/SigA [Fimbriimonadaceae bacterium]|nr:RNA polymerase sigma factor RpoD/SigA [Fimbriimonadaceae bacterium]HRJ97221.1 RNA polymerase sigma factor RpoD/SigA [Fimbriimonadaceae bacterium]
MVNMQYDWMEHDDALPSYLNRLTQAPLLRPDEEVALTRAAQKGDAKAKQRLVESNMRLVINIAKSYRSKAIPIEDLIQEGAIGLMHAAERFDPEKGFRFSTYATHWIRQSIGRALDNKAKAIRIPAHISQSLRKIERIRAQLVRELGTEPTTEQLAAAIGISPKRLQTLCQASQEMLSLDMRVGDSENTTLGNLLKDDNQTDPETECLSGEIMEELQHILMELNERERRVMSYRLRMDGITDENEVRDDLARELSLSRERVRQIELQAIKKLRAMAQRRQLRELLSQ